MQGLGLRASRFEVDCFVARSGTKPAMSGSPSSFHTPARHDSFLGGAWLGMKLPRPYPSLTRFSFQGFFKIVGFGVRDTKERYYCRGSA